MAGHLTYKKGHLGAKIGGLLKERFPKARSTVEH